MQVTEQPRIEDAEQQEGGKFLTFKLREESFGIGVLKIREIIRAQKITPVPQMPGYILGVINLRGRVIPVMDLRIRFNIGESKISERTCIVVVQTSTKERGKVDVGLLVDGVEEVLQIEGGQIEPAPEVGGNMKSSYVSGIAKIKDDVKTLLNIERIILDVPQTS